MTDKDFHPVANIFPLMSGDELQGLVDDINLHGLREPIWRHDGKIIDGRNRFTACLKAGVTPRYQEWDGVGSLVEFVVSLNLHRRHLNESQRAMVASKLANLGRGERADRARDVADRDDAKASSTVPPTTIPQAASSLNVSEDLVYRARTVRANAEPEIVEAVESGKLTLGGAVSVMNEEPAEQRRIAAKARASKKKLILRKPAKSKEEKEVKTDGTTIRIAIDTEDAEAAAAALAAALGVEYLEKLIVELSANVARTKAALSRGMGPAGRSK